MNAAAPSACVCPVCEAPSAFVFRSVYVDVAKCSSASCGHLHAISAPVGHGVQTHTEADAEAAMYRRRNASLVAFWRRRGFLPAGVKVLDIGAGAGHISSAIAHAVDDARIACIEADPESCRSLVRRGFECHPGLDQCDGAYDAILLVEVIEHIDAPVPFLRAVAARMRPGAKVFLSTPCGETTRGQRATNAYETREHVQFFTEQSLSLACEKAGFRRPRFEAVTELYPRRDGPKGALDDVKYALLPVRDAMRGRSHLIAFLERGD